VSDDEAVAWLHDLWVASRLEQGKPAELTVEENRMVARLMEGWAGRVTSRQDAAA
jgi:hypothetical protein